MVHLRKDYDDLEGKVFHEDEPVFLLRGKDPLFPKMVALYHKELVEANSEFGTKFWAETFQAFISYAERFRKRAHEFGFKVRVNCPTIPRDKMRTWGDFLDIMAKWDPESYKADNDAVLGWRVIGPNGFEARGLDEESARHLARVLTEFPPPKK